MAEGTRCTEAHRAVLATLAARIDEVLDPLVPGDRPVALLDFPQTPNVGDSVIWLGVMTYLKRRGIRPCYQCSNRTYSPATLARRIGNGTILLSGGGNFGDLYLPHQELREAVVRGFPRNPIVQLPQTIHFETTAALAAARAVFDAHPEVTLLARDDGSLDVARASFRARSILCPDAGFALGALPRPAAPAHRVVWLARGDKEAPALPREEVPPGVARMDWLQDDTTPLLTLSLRLAQLLRHRPATRAPLQGTLSATYEAVARQRVRRGARLLGGGRVVVTNRLHGHILSMLLGIRHVVLDNSYGKVSAFYRTWTHDSPLAEWAATEQEALARALGLAEGCD